MRVQATAQDGKEWDVQRKRGLRDEWGDAKLHWSETLGLTVRFVTDAENADVVKIPHTALEVRLSCPGWCMHTGIADRIIDSADLLFTNHNKDPRTI